MEDGEVELCDRHIVGDNPTKSGSVQESASTYPCLYHPLKITKKCTHTHTCNPPGPGSAVHTHTCYHTHTQLICSGENKKTNNSSATTKPRRPLGNREAVMKYREKKKAHAAYLEEVKKLRLLNQHLVRKLQERAILESEVLRLKSLLVDLKGRIDYELGLFSFQKQCSNSATTSSISFKQGESGAQSSDGASGPCFHTIVVGPSFLTGCIGEGKDTVLCRDRDCQPAAADCQVSGMSTGGDYPIFASETLA